MAKQIKVDGSEHILPNLKLKTIQKAVDGYFEIVKLANGYMLVNEEGLLRNLPVNKRASEIAGQKIVGNVILCGVEELS